MFSLKRYLLDISQSYGKKKTMLRGISEYARRADNRRVAQILLAYVDVCSSNTSLPTRRKGPGEVFANNYLHMGHVNVVGFDLDYTLVNYTNKLQGKLRLAAFVCVLVCLKHACLPIRSAVV